MAATFEHQTQIWKYIPSLSQGLIPQWLYLFQSLGCWWNNYFLQKNYSCKKVYSLKALFLQDEEFKLIENGVSMREPSKYLPSIIDLSQTLFCDGFNGFTVSWFIRPYSAMASMDLFLFRAWDIHEGIEFVCERCAAMKLLKQWRKLQIQCDNHWFKFQLWDVLFLDLIDLPTIFNQLGSSHVTTCPVKTWSPYRQSTERAPWSPRPGRHDRAPAQFAAPHRGESSPVACTSIQGTGSRSGRSLAPPPLLLWVAVMGK